MSPISILERLDLTRGFCTSGSEREFTLEGSWSVSPTGVYAQDAIANFRVCVLMNAVGRLLRWLSGKPCGNGLTHATAFG
jgi:hypothetical protein